MKKISLFAVGILLSAFMLTNLALAQVPSAQPVFEIKREIKTHTLTAQAAGTINADLVVSTGRGLKCTFNQASHTGTPSTTFSIFYKDGISNQYAAAAALTSGAITADNTPTSITIYPGLAVTANVSANDVVPRVVRVQVVVAGTTPVVTGTAACNEIP